MYLKSYLKKCFTESIAQLKGQIARIENAQRVLESTNTRKATYKVKMTSLWEGEKSTETEHEGSLEEAIRKAELEFKTTNKRSDLQAQYSVRIVLESSECLVPQEYWDQYRERH